MIEAPHAEKAIKCSNSDVANREVLRTDGLFVANNDDFTFGSLLGHCADSIEYA
jgi:hypothetical protein